MILLHVYRVTHLVANLGWVDLQIRGVPPAGGRYCSYLLPQQDGGTSQIKVNPTQVRHQMGHPVESVDYSFFSIF